MKTNEEIEKKIKLLQEEIEELNDDREEKKNKFGGISDEENKDFFDDINYKWCEIKTLQWVLVKHIKKHC
jgi:peptidoglycan hydrolase CwlO-like protein